ncbi:MAG: hypothetical protein HY718_14865, partial [Planctomycetes bacterium]|nr:hypothetical protein [Planctomycetota bacterium]
MKTPRLILSVVFVSLSAVPLFAQFDGGPARPQRPGQPLPPGPMGGLGPQAGFGTRSLKPRRLEDRPLDEKDQRKYDAAIAPLEKRSGAAGRSGAQAAPTQEAVNQFRLGSAHLRFGQEQAAEEAFIQAWESLVPLMKEPRSFTAALAQVRTYLRELQTVGGRDPELMLTLMSDLTPQHQAVYDAVEPPKSKPSLANPIAAAWIHLTQMGQLDRDTLEKGAPWMLLFPQMAMADRPLSAEQRSEYQAQLTQANIAMNRKMEDLANRWVALAAQAAGDPRQPSGRLPRIRPRDPNAPETHGEVDPVVAQAMAALEPKRGAIARFVEAEIAFRWGQSRDGLDATGSGWKELLEYYRSNPRNVSPVDSQLHFDALRQLVETNPVQMALVLDQLDAAYRTMMQIDRGFAPLIADEWIKL